MQVKIDRISYPGVSVSAQSGKIILTDEGLPGETVETCGLREKKNYIRARTLTVIERSPYRVAPRCSHYRICSPYQYMDYGFQCDLKQSQLSLMAKRALGNDLPTVSFTPSPRIWGYRNKISLSLRKDRGRLSYAYHIRDRQKEFEPVKECFLVSPLMNDFLASLLDRLSSAGISFVKEVLIRENSDKKMLAGLVCPDHYDRDLLKDTLSGLGKAFPLKGIVSLAGPSHKEQTLYGTPFLEEQVSGTAFILGISSFFQVNLPAFENMLDDLKRLISLSGSETLLDLYCGVGTIGLVLSPLAGRVLALESAGENFSFTGRNAEMNSRKNIEFYTGKSEIRAKALLAEKPDLVIVDPPRKGLDQKTCALITSFLPGRLVYISCDPATLMRDLKLLSCGYKVIHLAGYDFFPHTPHIECLALLEKK